MNFLHGLTIISKIFCRERSFVATYTSAEISYAHTLGYKILDFFEIYAYKTEGKIFERYMRVLSYFKLKVCKIETKYQV